MQRQEFHFFVNMNVERNNILQYDVMWTTNNYLLI